MQPAAEVPGRIRVEGDAHIEFRKLWLNPAGHETDRVLRVEPAAAGTMLLDGLQPDVYTLPVYGMPPQFYFKSERQGERDLLALGLDTSLSTGPVEIVLSPDGGEVAGTAAVGATVVLVPGPERRAQIQLWKNTTADAQGRFLLRGVAPGDYRVFAWQEIEDGGWFDPAVLQKNESHWEKVTVRESARETVQVTAIPPR